MRTTITIDDRLMETLKKQAFGRNLTVSLLIQESVRSYLAQQSAESEQKTPFELVTYGAGGRFPDINLDKTSLQVAQDDLERYGRRS